MKKFRILRLHPIAFVGLMTILGCSVGSALYLLSPYIPFGAWELAIAPPVKAVRLLAYRYPQVFITTDDSKIYACQPLTHWQLVDPSLDRQRNTCILAGEPKNTPYKDPFCPDPNPQTPLAPGKIIDTLAVRDCAPDGYVDVHLIVLDDGTVWQWWNFQGGYGNEIFLLAVAGLGALAGLVVSVILILGMGLWSRLHKR